MDAGPTVPSEVPDKLAAHRVTISYDQVKRHSEETGDRSLGGLHSSKILFTVANKHLS